MHQQEYSIIVTMDRNAQVLDRILHIFSRRGISLDKVKLSPFGKAGSLQQLCLMFREEEIMIKKIMNQISKQVDVMEVRIQ